MYPNMAYASIDNLVPGISIREPGTGLEIYSLRTNVNA